MINNEESHTPRKQLFSVDCAKFVLALLVVSMHTHLFENASSDISSVVYYVYSIVLPLFFFFSGTLFFNNPDGTSRKINGTVLFGKCKRVLILYLFWLIPNLPTFYIKMSSLKNSSALVPTIIFSGTYMASWFLVALFWCMLIAGGIMILTKNRWADVILISLSIFFYLLFVGALGDSSLVLRDVLAIPYSFPAGLLFFVLGKYAFKVQSKQIIWPIVILSLILYVLHSETWYLKPVFVFALGGGDNLIAI